MNRIIRQLTASLTLLFAVSIHVYAAPVWKVEYKNNTLYLAGTIHVLRAEDKIPKAFETAYQASSHLVFETDIGQLEGPAMQQFILSQALYTDGTTLEKALTKPTYQALQQYTQTVGFPLKMMNTYKPGFVYLTLLGLELQKLGINQTGVDKTYYQKALADNKTTQGLEAIDDHLQLLLQLGDGNQEKFVQYFLEELSKFSTEVEKLMTTWKSGNLKDLDTTLIQPMKSEHPMLYQQLMTNRNLAWLPIIEKLAKTPETEMVLVGAAHLAGKDGLIELLSSNNNFLIEPFSHSSASKNESIDIAN